MITSVVQHNACIFEFRTRKRWRVHQDVEFTCYAGDKAVLAITVAAGFESDGASTPPGFRWLIPRWHRKYGAAVLLHDYLYRHPDLCEAIARQWHLGGREFADRLMHMATGPTWRRDPMFLAVRWFGWLAYGKGEA